MPNTHPCAHVQRPNLPDASRWRFPALRSLPVLAAGFGLSLFLANAAAVGPKGPAKKPQDDPKPRIAVHFQDTADQVFKEPTMRFGLTLADENDPKGKTKDNPTGKKRLTFFPHGHSNNTCLRIDDKEYLFGGKEGTWEKMKADLPGKNRHGARSVWLAGDSKIKITQTVEIVRGSSGLLDTCLVRYRIENTDDKAHQVGIRFLLDTFIGTNDGVPFVIPGEKELCDTSRDFNKPAKIPEFIVALEHPNLAKPGTVAHVGLKVGRGLETPSRVTLGAWPHLTLKANLDMNDPNYNKINQHLTLWDVPVLSMKTEVDRKMNGVKEPLNDSAVAIYWKEKELKAGGKREVGFTYGLGDLTAATAKGRIAVVLGGVFEAGKPITLTALVNEPAKGETVTLELPKGLSLVEGKATQEVAPAEPKADSKYSPVTWKIKADRARNYEVTIKSSKGTTLKRAVRIK
jgi:hypothetical protein